LCCGSKMINQYNNDATETEARETNACERLGVYSLFALLAVSGTTHTLLAKTLYELPARGAKLEDEKLFRKPYFMTFVMMFALSLSGVYRWVFQRKIRSRLIDTRDKIVEAQSPLEPLLSNSSQFESAVSELQIDSPRQHSCEVSPSEASDPGSRTSLRLLCAAALPSILDMTATIISNIGLLYITVSVHQLLRSSILIFSVAIAIPLHGAQLRLGHFAGVLFCLMGIMIVGCSHILGTATFVSVESDHDSDSDMEMIPKQHIAHAMFLVIFAQFFQAAGIHIEQHLLSTWKLQPELLLKVESMVGTLAMALLVLPAAYFLPGMDHDGRQVVATVLFPS